MMKPFTYVPNNVPGPGASTADFEAQLQGCTCNGDCSSYPSKCACLKFGPNYSSGLFLRDSSDNRPVQECNSNCACDDATCSNRVVQRCISHQLDAFSADPRSKGFGLRTLEPISKGAFVCEYAGETLGPVEAQRRARGKMVAAKFPAAANDSSSNYLIVLREHVSCSATQTTDVVKTYIDAEHYGNLGRFANHSCDPNLFMVPVRIENLVPHLSLFARRDIAAGDELTYHYGGNDFLREAVSPSNKLLSAACEDNLFARICACGALNCLGRLPFDAELYADMQDTLE